MNEMKTTEKISLDEIAESLLPREEEFAADPFLSGKQKWQKAKLELIEELKMPAYRMEIMNACNYIAEEMRKMNSESQLLFRENMQKLSDYTAHSSSSAEEFFNLSQTLGLQDCFINEITGWCEREYEEKNYDRAAALATFLCTMQMSLPRPWLLRGLAYLAMKQHEKAEQAFSQTIQLQPHEPQPYLFLAQALYAQGQKGAALDNIALAQDMIKHNPERQEWSQFADSLIYEMNVK